MYQSASELKCAIDTLGVRWGEGWATTARVSESFLCCLEIRMQSPVLLTDHTAILPKIKSFKFKSLELFTESKTNQSGGPLKFPPVLTEGRSHSWVQTAVSVWDITLFTLKPRAEKMFFMSFFLFFHKYWVFSMYILWQSRLKMMIFFLNS